MLAGQRVPDSLVEASRSVLDLISVLVTRFVRADKTISALA